jgi:hypothetical protein
LGAGICPLARLRIVRRDFPNPMKSTACQGVKAQLATGSETFVFNQALAMSLIGTFRTSRDVWLESVMRGKAELPITQPTW